MEIPESNAGVHLVARDYARYMLNAYKTAMVGTTADDREQLYYMANAPGYSISSSEIHKQVFKNHATMMKGYGTLATNPGCLGMWPEWMRAAFINMPEEIQSRMCSKYTDVYHKHFEFAIREEFSVY